MDTSGIKKFFQENPLALIAVGAAILVFIVIVGTGYDVQIARFFAANERCPGRAAQPPDWVPDWVCAREPEYDYALDQGCLPTHRGASGTGEFLYMTDRRPEPDSGVVWEQYPKMCVEKPQDCPRNWVAFGDAYCIRTCDERAGGTGCTGSTGDTDSCPAYSGTPSTPQLSAQCGSTQNALTWTNPLSGRANENLLQRMVGTGGSWTTIFTEGGCWNTFGIGSQTDSNISAGQTYQYRVKFGPNTVSNTVTCAGGSASPTPAVSVIVLPTPTPAIPVALLIEKTGRNLTTGGADSRTSVAASPGDTIQFTLRITTQTVAANDVLVRDTLPAELQPLGQVAETITSSGVFLQTIDPRQERVVTWRAQALTAGQLPVGTGTVVATTQVTGTGFSPQTLQVPVVITNTGSSATSTTGTTGSVGTVQTGPGDAVVLALVIGSIVSLLYVSWTRTPLFRARQAQRISEEKDTLDFKS